MTSTTDSRVDLLRAIRDHSGLELAAIRDAGQHGADAGWGGFTYTTDCVEFYDANEDAIYDLLREDADSMGYPNVDAMVATFNRSDMLDDPDGRKTLLAWYALEEVGRWLQDRRDSR
jgi:hypothetical protein